ncbi:MAG: MFS transporter [Candidatus Marinimicrobia bacterium CG1_02_48_14]|nr:MAG: MFS transporter [Candidatus Marinimicrobia bacterium CG1_02_48_14]PJA51908.1 MAG: MFS transporter [Candidatus Marinimicrobia bacterium CG_4_9_14_3_um_filter_48_9]
MKDNKKGIWGWAMYDWANSAFATTVMAGFFPVFFKQYWSSGADVNTSTALLGFGNAIASLVVAIMAPILGAIADKASAKKKFLIFFAYLGVLMTAALYMVAEGNWMWAIFIYAMGIIGFSGANVFYDSLLPSVVSEEKIDYVSGLGFAMGYLGGGLLFLVNVLMTQMPEAFGLANAGEAVRWSFLTVALWWGGFTLFTIFWVEETKYPKVTTKTGNFITEGFGQLKATFGKIRHMKTIFLFLSAYWLYIDGVDTIIRMAVDYGMSIGFDSSDLIKALLITQFVGFPAAWIFGKLGETWSVRKSIFIAIGVYIGVTIWGVQMTQKIEFYILAIVIGLVQGGIQALSRSYYSRLIPKSQAGEFYGFYNMLGKFAAIIGPALMGLVGLIVRRILMPVAPTPEQVVEIGHLASRWGIGSILILFIAGGILFYFVDDEKGRAEAKYLEAHAGDISA